MRRLGQLAVATAIFCGALTPAWAGCNPPGGLNPQQWYAACGMALQQDYQMGAGQGAPFQAFAQAMYMQYMQSGMQQMPQQQPYPQTQPQPFGMTPMPAQQPAMAQGVMNCQLGQTMCVVGWLRTCEPVGSGSMWKTGAQHC